MNIHSHKKSTKKDIILMKLPFIRRMKQRIIAYKIGIYFQSFHISVEDKSLDL